MPPLQASPDIRQIHPQDMPRPTPPWNWQTIPPPPTLCTSHSPVSEAALRWIRRPAPASGSPSVSHDSTFVWSFPDNAYHFPPHQSVLWWPPTAYFPPAHSWDCRPQSISGPPAPQSLADIPPSPPCFPPGNSHIQWACCQPPSVAIPR